MSSTKKQSDSVGQEALCQGDVSLDPLISNCHPGILPMSSTKERSDSATQVATACGQSDSDTPTTGERSGGKGERSGNTDSHRFALGAGPLTLVLHALENNIRLIPQIARTTGLSPDLVTATVDHLVRTGRLQVVPLTSICTQSACQGCAKGPVCPLAGSTSKNPFRDSTIKQCRIVRRKTDTRPYKASHDSTKSST